MADVRLTATNPEDSSVVPVACNEKGELLLEEPTLSSDDYVAKAGDTMTGNLHLGDKITLNPDGSAQFANGKIDFYEDGSAEFFEDLILKVPENIDTKSITLQAPGGRIQCGIFLKKTSQDAVRYGQISFKVHNANVEKTPLTLNSNGSADFTGDVVVHKDPTADVANLGLKLGAPALSTNQYSLNVRAPSGTNVFNGFLEGAGSSTSSISAIGGATFSSDVIIGSRNKKWMIVESNGLAHLVEQTRNAGVDTADLTHNYPPLRDIPGELTMVEQQLQKVLEKLRMIPEAGWEVWDGSD